MKKNIENFTKEVSVVYERAVIHGQYHFDKRKEGMCKAYEYENRGYPKKKTSLPHLKDIDILPK